MNPVLPLVKPHTAAKAASGQVRVTLTLDRDILDYFRRKAARPGAWRMSAVINAELRTIVEQATLSPAERRDQMANARRILNRLFRKPARPRPRILPKGKRHAAR